MSVWKEKWVTERTLAVMRVWLSARPWRSGEQGGIEPAALLGEERLAGGRGAWATEAFSLGAPSVPQSVKDT